MEKKKNKVLVLPELSGSFPNACAYLRILCPLWQLVRDHNLQVILPSNIIRSTTLEIANLLNDVVLISTQRTAPFQSPINRGLIEAAKLRQIPIHWDLDDLPLGGRATIKETDYMSSLRESIAEMRSTATYVTTSTQEIQISLNEQGFPKVMEYRNSLPDGLWAPVNKPIETNLLFYGLGGHQKGLEFVSNKLHKYNLRSLQRHNIRFFAVGPFSGKFHPNIERVAIPKGRFSYLAFASWLPTVITSGIGIIYHEDNTLNRAKSALKAIEYGAMGMATLSNRNQAVVSDEVRSYTKLVDDEVFIEEIIELAADKKKVKSLAADVFDYVNNQRLLSRDSRSMSGFFLELLF